MTTDQRQFTKSQLEQMERINNAVKSARRVIFEELQQDNKMPLEDFVQVTLFLAELAVTGEGQIPPAESYGVTKAFLRELVMAIKPQPAQMLM